MRTLSNPPRDSPASFRPADGRLPRLCGPGSKVHLRVGVELQGKRLVRHRLRPQIIRGKTRRARNGKIDRDEIARNKTDRNEVARTKTCRNKIVRVETEEHPRLIQRPCLTFYPQQSIPRDGQSVYPNVSQGEGERTMTEQQTNQRWIGIDVSKVQLDIAVWAFFWKVKSKDGQVRLRLGVNTY